ncbi:MAG: protein kinase, partial [Gluconacetobacter diazotrophicus]|nr:protein kinase [Gluconacetobacter diazotrophicus]
MGEVASGSEPPSRPVSAGKGAIGRFEIVSTLGEGAMGVVYRAFDPAIHRPVAIKLVRSNLLESADRESYLDRFRHEVRVAGRFAHPNIVGVYDFALHGGNPYIVMEHVEGGPLNRVYRRGTRGPVAAAIRIGTQILAALEYAHGFGVVHRDIKPANILLTQGLNVKVTDFGISRLISSDTTVDQLMIGTPSYMSPEQARGERVDPRSDLFSLGSVLYELLSGTQPFSGMDYNGTIHRLMHLPHEPLSRHRDDVPAELAAVLDQALQKQPGDRFPDAGSFAQALRDVPHRTESWTGWMPGSAGDPVPATGEVATGAGPAARPGGTPSGEEDDATAATMVIERWRTPPPARTPVPMEVPTEAPGPTDAAADPVAGPVAKRDDGNAGTPPAVDGPADGPVDRLVDGPVDENGRERVRLALAHVLG